MPEATDAPVSRYPVPTLDAMPEDIRARILKVQEKSGFVPNVFLMLAYRPDEFRAFMAYHDALMDKPGGLTQAEGAVSSYVGIGCRRAGLHEIIGSGGKCNGRIGQRLGERGPAIDLPHLDLS